MPVEIRELVIKATIVSDEHEGSLSNPDQQPDTDKEQIIQECVNQVLKIINKNKSR